MEQGRIIAVNLLPILGMLARSRSGWLVLATLASTMGCDRAETGPPTLAWYVFDEPSGAFREAAARCSASSEGRYAIALKPLPSDADQQREQIVRRLAAGDPDIDLIGMDVIWTAEFASAGWIVPWPDPAAWRIAEGRLPAAVATARYADRLWAVPFTSNAQLLWYRKDRVSRVPVTWSELLRQAEASGVRGSLQLQGQRYEGLTVFFVSLLASAGGRVLDEDGGGVSLEEGPTVETLALMKRLATSVAADPSLATITEDQARLAFETGRPTFMLNYSFVWPSARQNAPDIAARMGFARWPAVHLGRPSRVAIGGLNLGVASFSRHRWWSFEAAECLASEPHQVLAVTRGGLPPTLEALYDLPEVRRRLPFAEPLRDTLRDAVLRPVSPVYNDISLAISRSLHPMRDLRPRQNAVKLRRAVLRALRSEGLW